MKAAVLASAVGLAWLSGAVPQPVAAQTAAADRQAVEPRGMLKTQAFKELPRSLTVSVAPYDDTELNLSLKRELEALLKDDARIQVARDAEAGYLLLFESGVIPADAVPRGPSLGSAQVGSAGVDVSVNVWSSTQDSLLGGRQDPANVDSNNLFHINVVLRDRSSGTVIWQGDAYHRLVEPDRERVARGMVAPLVKKIGQTVAREPFNITP